MNVTLPEARRTYVEVRVRDEGYASSGVYMRELLRRDRGRERPRTLIFEGVASGPARRVGHDEFHDLVEALDALDRSAHAR